MWLVKIVLHTLSSNKQAKTFNNMNYKDSKTQSIQELMECSDSWSNMKCALHSPKPAIKEAKKIIKWFLKEKTNTDSNVLSKKLKLVIQ